MLLASSFFNSVQTCSSRSVHPCTPATFGPSMDVIANSKLVPPTAKLVPPTRIIPNLLAAFKIISSYWPAVLRESFFAPEVLEVKIFDQILIHFRIVYGAQKLKIEEICVQRGQLTFMHGTRFNDLCSEVKIAKIRCPGHVSRKKGGRGRRRRGERKEGRGEEEEEAGARRRKRGEGRGKKREDRREERRREERKRGREAKKRRREEGKREEGGKGKGR